jgi:ABC-type uncharacterized transport system auxiliary subunit
MTISSMPVFRDPPGVDAPGVGAPRIRGLILAAVLGCVCLAACGSVLDSGKPARQVYLLHTPTADPTAAHATAQTTAPSLLISVTAVPGLDSDRIMALGNDARLVPVANAHWPDHMPEVFTSIVRRYLSETRQFHSVQDGGIARPGEWQLELELQAFYGLLDAGGSTTGVQLRVEGLLRCGDARHVLRVAEESGVDSGSLASLVAAHQRVVDAALKGLPQRIMAACAMQDPA